MNQVIQILRETTTERISLENPDTETDTRLGTFQAITTEERELQEAGERRKPGHCMDCGEPIPPQRLAAFPNAVRCKDCKEDWEAEQKRLLARRQSRRH